MEHMKRNKRKQALFCLLVLSVTLCFARPAFAAPAANPLALSVVQGFTVQDGEPASDTFSYRLTAVTPGAPMPAGSTGGSYSFTVSGTNSRTLPPVPFTQVGAYTYEIAPVIDQRAEGYTYDEQVYSLSVYVDDDLDTEIVIGKADGTKTQAVRFENSFALKPSDPSVMVDPPIKKTVMGNPDSKGVFTFKLEAADKTSPMPEGSEDGVKLMTIIGPGEEDFGTWSYTKSGTYYYTVSEINNSEKGYAYDTQIYTITDSVKNENGQLVVSRTVTNVFNKPVGNYTFINQYDGSAGGSGIAGGTGTIGGIGASGGKGILGPKTGDDTNAVSLMITILTAAVTALCCAVYLLLHRRRKGSCSAWYQIRNG